VVFAQNMNIDSLHKVQEKRRIIAEAQTKKVDDAIKRIESFNLSEKDLNALFQSNFDLDSSFSYSEYLENYYTLKQRDEYLQDSIELQITEIINLIQEINSNEVLTTRQLDSLRDENLRLKSIMKNYINQIDVVKNLKSCDVKDANDFYFDLNSHRKPKIYYYECPEDSKKSQYWKVKSKKENLITEAFSSTFNQFEYFKEKFDSSGSFLVNYEMINKGNVTNCSIEENKVYLWNSSEAYSYQVRYLTDNGYVQFRKTRNFLRKDSIQIMDALHEVLVFSGHYEFINETYKDTLTFNQFSYYSAGLGFVKYERMTPINSIEYDIMSLELKTVLTKKEWRKMIK
jgi:hypothetical protein